MMYISLSIRAVCGSVGRVLARDACVTEGNCHSDPVSVFSFSRNNHCPTTGIL